MTDAEILAIARKINKHQLAILDLIGDIKDSDHPNKEQIANNIEENIFVSASAAHCAYRFFSHPELYELDGFDIKRRKRGKQ